MAIIVLIALQQCCRERALHAAAANNSKQRQARCQIDIVAALFTSTVVRFFMQKTSSTPLQVKLATRLCESTVYLLLYNLNYSEKYYTCFRFN